MVHASSPVVKRHEIPEAVTWLGAALAVIGTLAAVGGWAAHRHLKRKARGKR